VITDCTEFQIETPRRDLEAAGQSFSNYKHYFSAKYLIGVAPNGAITFISGGFPGSARDKMITNESRIISHLKVCKYGVVLTHTCLVNELLLLILHLVYFNT